MQETQVSGSIGNQTVKLTTGKMAKQANGCVLAQVGDCILMATAVMSKSPREGIDFFPLTVEFSEKMYAAGKIPGGFFKREARPSTDATLTARLIDRPLRPSFPDDFYHEVQIIITILSYDPAVPTDSLSIIAASAALSISDIPFNGPIGASTVIELDGQLIANPTVDQLEKSTLEITVAGTKDAVLMIESESVGVSEERIIEAIEVAHTAIKQSVSIQEELVSKIGKAKKPHTPIEDDIKLKSEIDTFLGDKIEQNMQSANKEEAELFLKELEESVYQKFISEGSDEQIEAQVKRLYGKLKKSKIRNVILKKKIRPDGRKVNEIRSIYIDTAVLPSTHGSALFTRGETQSLGVVTLGTSADQQIMDGLADSEKSSYYFHYNFPPFSVGETGFLRTGRRELGHGALAQKALKGVLPKTEDFPYTIRIVSEILESNGSSSMASVCSGSLSLMDAGVPTKNSVSGIAMGLLIDGDDYVILSDIQGLEDHYGDMDFKVAGTVDGITALQLDIKVSGLSSEILRNALSQAKEGRLEILGKMDDALASSRPEISSKAPQIEFMMINPEKVGMLIGPGGKMIKKIEEDSGATVFVVDGTKGEVSIAAPDAKALSMAREMVNGIVRDVEKGDTFTGKVVKIVNFGAFLQLGATGKEALLHISKISDKRIEKVEDHLEIGQELDVSVQEVDQSGRISLVLTK